MHKSRLITAHPMRTSSRADTGCNASVGHAAMQGKSAHRRHAWARVNHGGSGFGSRWPFRHANRLVGTRFQTTPAFNAARAKIGFIRRSWRTKKLFAIAGEADCNATSGHSGRGDCAKRCRFHFPPPVAQKPTNCIIRQKIACQKGWFALYLWGRFQHFKHREVLDGDA